MASVIGQRVRRHEDPRFLMGRGQYVDDVPIEGALHVTFIRSPWAHARVGEIDSTAAADVPGARVFTAADVGLAVNPTPPFIEVDPRMFRPFVASDTARFAGDIVAVVLAPSRAASVDAAELVQVEYEPLPAVTDLDAALRGDVLLFDEVGTNVCLRHAPEAPDPQLFDDCEVVVRGATVSPRLAACPIEPRATLAQFDDGRLTIWISTQTPHTDKMVLGLLLGLEPEQVRVVAPDVGGGFGGKGLAVEDVIVAWLARAIGQPVRWTETRSENLVAMHQGRAQRIEFELGGSRDGRVSALRINILQDAGAYPGIGSFLPMLTAMMSSGVYAIPKIEADVTAVVTNTTPTGPVRGAGRPEATQMIERAMDIFAAEISLDPAEVRRRNLIAADAFPYQTASGGHYDCGNYVGALDLVLEHAGYDALREEQAARRRAARRGSSESVSASTSKSRTGSTRRSSARSKSPRRVRPSSSAAPSRRDRVTRRPSRRSRPSGSACRWRRSPLLRATPTGSLEGPARTARSRPRSAGPPRPRRPKRSLSGQSNSPPRSSRRASRTWSSTSTRDGSTSPAPRSRR